MDWRVNRGPFMAGFLQMEVRNNHEMSDEEENHNKVIGQKRRSVDNPKSKAQKNQKMDPMDREDSYFALRLLNFCRGGDSHGAFYCISNIKSIMALTTKDLYGKNAFHYANNNQACEEVAKRIQEIILKGFIEACKSRNQANAEDIFCELPEFDLSLNNCIEVARTLEITDQEAVNDMVETIIAKAEQAIMDVPCVIQ